MPFRVCITNNSQLQVNPYPHAAIATACILTTNLEVVTMETNISNNLIWSPPDVDLDPDSLTDLNPDSLTDPDHDPD
jgi:hypothetical protein